MPEATRAPLVTMEETTMEIGPPPGLPAPSSLQQPQTVEITPNTQDMTKTTDYWTHEGHRWIRHHVTERSTLFTPIGTRDGPDASKLEDTRITKQC